MELPGYNNLTCHQAQLKMSLYIENDSYLTDEECKAFEEHLESCAECVREYEESRFVISLVKRYWTVSEDTLALIEKANQSTKARMTVEEGWEDLKRRIPELAQLENRQKRFRLFYRVGAVAACLFIGISIILTFSYYSKPKIAQELIPEQVVFAPKPSVKVKLVSENGNILIPAGHEITTAKELKTLIINNQHRMAMNNDTALLIEPLVENNRIGCMVKLTSGEILANVEHDGNPFVVSTAHGKAVITGTTFDIKATNHNTILVVADGNVRFESEEGVVNIAAGQISKIVGQSAPSIPLSCNTAELTAWATGYKPGLALAQAESNTELWELPLSLGKEPIVLEEIDYDYWIEQKQDWFKQEFPWIFELKDALTKEGIEVNYLELLIKSGDIWQFVCLGVRPPRFSVIVPNSLLKVASNYGFDKQWLLENVPAAKNALEQPVLSENSFTGLKAFERWLKYLDETEELKLPTPLYSYHASKYLANTRSLIWFAVRDGKYDLTDEERAEVLFLLQKEVTSACQCQNVMLYPADNPKPSYDDICREPVNNVVEYIKTMMAIEKVIESVPKIHESEKENPKNESSK